MSTHARLWLCFLAVILAVACRPCAAASVSRPASRARPVNLVYATARLGEVLSCGCTPEKGGLARQASLLRELCRANEIGLVEAGDTFFHDYRIPPEEAPRLVRRAHELVKLLQAQGLFATSVGECDLAIGLGVLEELARRSSIRVLCANLITLQGRRPFQPSAVVNVGSLRVGLVGLVSERLGIEASHPDIRIEDPAKRLAATLANLPPKLDRIVLLAHMPPGQAEALAKSVRGLDLVVLGHAGGRLAPPVRIGRTLLVGSDIRGREIGVVDLEQLRAAPARCQRLVGLSSDIPEDPGVAAGVRALNAPGAQGVELPPASLEITPTAVGRAGATAPAPVSYPTRLLH